MQVRLNREDGQLVDGPDQGLETIVLDGNGVFYSTGEGMNASGIQVILEANVYDICVHLYPASGKYARIGADDVQQWPSSFMSRLCSVLQPSAAN